MQATPRLRPRQLWAFPSSRTSATPTVYCTAFTLPSNGVLSFGTENLVTLTTDVFFSPECTGFSSPADSVNSDEVGDPFYASSTPQVYVIAAATVMAWVLVIMLVIAPRTFFRGGPSGASSLSFLGGRGVIGGANGGRTSWIGAGSRPWLQKAAALLVAIALTIATADTFITTSAHYPAGIDGNSLREDVENSLEIRITRVISDIFVWLAQVQTLIRLFPRHKEKVLIKWIGFALIILDTTFSCLNSFYIDSPRRPRDFVDAIPALSYLFELAMGLLYAAWVMYYSITMRRYAFWHPLMKNICILALLSYISILTPVVFFVTDVTLPNVAGWGDYFRWVGAAAASVVVWEWVERIEAIEREEKKDGILGREIFDGDEMLDTHPSDDITYVPRRNDMYYPQGYGDQNTSGSEKYSLTSLARRIPRKGIFAHKKNDHSDNSPTKGNELSGTTTAESKDQNPLSSLTPPPNAVSPPNRTDTTSAGSTVYVVRHDGTNDGIQPVRRQAGRTPETAFNGSTDDGHDDQEYTQTSRWRPAGHWHTVSNPFKRKRTTPPAEVQAAMVASADERTTTRERTKSFSNRGPKWKSRLGALSDTRDRLRGKDARQVPDLGWTVIPAQPRGAAAWSPGFGNTASSAASPPIPDTVPAAQSMGSVVAEHSSQPQIPGSVSFSHIPEGQREDEVEESRSRDRGDPDDQDHDERPTDSY
ncbi:hypothetical protein MBLNU457_6181t1 [Dothideomycetes sp. NU457]